MARELESGELLEELKGFDLVLMFDDELALSVARPDRLTEGELRRSLIGMAFSSREKGRALCWSLKEGKFLVEDVELGEAMSLRPDIYCSEEFQRLLEDEGLKLELTAEERRTLTLEKALEALGGGKR